MTRHLTIALAAIVALPVTACGDSGAASPANPCGSPAAAVAKKAAAPPASDLVKAGTLTMASDVNYPPQEFYPDGCGKTADGFDIDMGRALAARMGLNFKLVDTHPDDPLQALGAKKADLAISALNITDDRQQQARLEPYLVGGEAIVVPLHGKKAPQDIVGLCGLKVAVEKGTAEERDATEANDPAKNGPCAKNPIDLKDKVFDSDPPALAALRKGNVDAHFTDVAVAAYEVMTSSDLRTTTGTVLNPVSQGIAVRKDDDAMFKAIDTAFKAMVADGTYKRLLGKWRLDGAEVKPAS